MLLYNYNYNYYTFNTTSSIQKIPNPETSPSVFMVIFFPILPKENTDKYTKTLIINILTPFSPFQFSFISLFFFF